MRKRLVIGLLAAVNVALLGGGLAYQRATMTPAAPLRSDAVDDAIAAAWRLASVGQRQGAERCLRDALTADLSPPRQRALQLQVARLHARYGNFTEAAALYDRWNAPPHPVVAEEHAAILMRCGRHADAAKLLQGLPGEPSIGTLVTLAEALAHDERNLVAARTTARKVLAMDAGHARARWLDAAIALRLEGPQAALRAAALDRASGTSATESATIKLPRAPDFGMLLPAAETQVPLRGLQEVAEDVRVRTLGAVLWERAGQPERARAALLQACRIAQQGSRVLAQAVARVDTRGVLVDPFLRTNERGAAWRDTFPTMEMALVLASAWNDRPLAASWKLEAATRLNIPLGDAEHALYSGRPTASAAPPDDAAWHLIAQPAVAAAAAQQ